MSDIGNQQIFQLLTEVRDDVKATAAAVTKLEIHVKGNGGKGLLQRQDAGEERLDTLEEWRAKRPKVCPATAKEVMKSIGRAVAIATAVLSLIMGLSLLANRRLIDPRLEKLQEQVLAVKDAVEKLNPE